MPCCYEAVTHVLIVFKDAGTDLQKTLVLHCIAGLSSCSVAIAAFMCGAQDVYVYHVSTISLGVLYHTVSPNLHYIMMSHVFLVCTSPNYFITT